MKLRGFGLEGLFDGVLHVGVELLDELKERLDLVLEHSLEGAVKVDDDFEREYGIVLVVIAKNVEHGGHEAVCIGFEDLLLWKAVSGLEDHVTKPLFGSVCGEAAGSGIEKGNKGRDDMFEKQGIVEVLEEVKKLLELKSGGQLCFGIWRRARWRRQKGVDASKSA